MQFARDMETELADQFVGMYVNKWTLGYGEKGRKQSGNFWVAARRGLIPGAGEIDFVAVWSKRQRRKFGHFAVSGEQLQQYPAFSVPGGYSKQHLDPSS